MPYGAIYSRDKSRYIDNQSILKYREDYRPNEPINFNGSFIHRHTGKERSNFPTGMLEETKKNILLLDHVFDKVHTFFMNNTIILIHLLFAWLGFDEQGYCDKPSAGLFSATFRCERFCSSEEFYDCRNV